MPKGIYIRTSFHRKIISGCNKNRKYINRNKTILKMSNSAKERLRLKKNHPMYKNIGTIVIHQGYKYIKESELIWKPLHCYVVEKYIGYKLKKEWIVHHIDGNSLNNDLSNLYIFRKKGYHSSLEILIKIKVINRFILKSNLKEFRREH
jgi:uncharacterized protein with WD repeat